MKKPKKNGEPLRPAPPPPGMIRVSHIGGELAIIDAAGLPVPGIIACDIAMRPGVQPLMRVNCAAGMFEVEGTPVFTVFDPRTGKMRPVLRIEFADGGPDFVAPEHQRAPQASPAPAPPAEPPAAAEPTQEAP